MKPLTDAEATDFAKRIYRGEVFTSWMIPEHAPDSLIRAVFMPLALMSEEQAHQMRADGVATLWANMAERIPLAINGLPIFYGCGMWTRADAELVVSKLRAIEALMDGI